MTLTQMNVLIAVLEYASFTEAGKRLHMTQSAVSQAVLAMEDELGVAILTREKGKPLRLTAFGERIVAHIRTIMQEVAAIRELAEQEKEAPSRTLSVGCFPSVCSRILPQVVRYFETHHPKIKVTLYEANSVEIMSALQRQEIDAGFVHFPVSGMSSTLVYKDRFTVVVPDSHPFAERSAVSVEELSKEPLIVSKGRYELSIMTLFKERNVIPNVQYEFNHPSTALSFIRQGLGIALLPGLALNSLAADMRAIALEPAFYRDITLVTSEQPVENSPVCCLLRCIEALKMQESLEAQ
ncbi:LysR family transcriptional regulator [Leminorella grimontii]|nr:LysR family transcriptional regulator [Leminorella grimontii]VFS58446.1 Morphology and auto-aggregation control protein [Leminorella grimontii]